jgi:hypothetical protein
MNGPFSILNWTYSPPMAIKGSKYKNIDFNNKNRKNVINSPDFVYLFLGELILTKKKHYNINFSCSIAFTKNL